MRNPDLVRTMQDLRRSSAAQPHVPKPYRKPKYKAWKNENEDGE